MSYFGRKMLLGTTVPRTLCGKTDIPSYGEGRLEFSYRPKLIIDYLLGISRKLPVKLWSLSRMNMRMEWY